MQIVLAAIVSGDALTVIGVVVGVAASAFFYWLGARASSKQYDSVAEAFRRQTEQLTDMREIERLVRDAGGDSNTAKQIASSFTAATLDSSVDLLVKASLGRLQDAHGNVSLQRLQRDVSSALQRPGTRDVSAALQRLRKEGVVDWDGGDTELTRTRTIRVNARPGGLSKSRRNLETGGGRP
jgi:hypothetical protein